MEFLKKNAGLIIFVGILLIVVWYYFLRKKKAESGYTIAVPQYSKFQAKAGRASVVGPSDKPTALRCGDGCPFSVLEGKCICPSM